MAEPRIVERDQIVLMGFSFFGDPFAASAGWTEENEIGRLWSRFMAYLMANSQLTEVIVNPQECYEVHVTHAETAEKGDFEVFVGAEIRDAHVAPLETVVKVLPASTYAVFTLEGEQISSDWHRMIHHEWLPGSGYEADMSYGFQLYDARFKGIENLHESMLDVYAPIR